MTMVIQDTLVNYLLKKFPDLTYKELIGHNEFDLHSYSFSRFLHSITVIELCSSDTNALQLPAISPELNSVPYSEYIDTIINQLCSSGLRNQTLDQFLFSRTTESAHKTSFQINYLKGEEWAKLCNRLGRSRFAEFLMNVLCYCEGLGVLLRISGINYCSRSAIENVNKVRMYYNWCSWDFTFSLLTGSPNQILSTILRGSNNSMNRVPQNARGMLKILSNAKRLDSSLNYHQLFYLIVKSNESSNVFENRSSFEDVLRFLLICLSKIFPDPTFGNLENKIKLITNIRTYLCSNRNDGFDVHSFLNQLDLSSIRWLGKSRTITSVQDRKLRQKLVNSFLKWLFGVFIPKMIKKFWYVTEISPKKISQSCSAYFPHRSWRRLTTLWMDNYVEKYLQEVELESNGIPKYFNHGFLRLIPKNNDFRPLCVPCDYSHHEGGSSGYHEAYKNYDWNVIRPIREILRVQQNKVQHGECPRNHSVRDICKRLAEFKQSLENNMKELPDIYGVKFDMRHCYDNLNQSKIIEIIEGLFAEENEHEEYYIRRLTKKKLLGSLHSHVSLLITRRSKVAELDIFNYPDVENKSRHILADGSKTWKFSKGQILDIVKQQVLNSTTELPGNHETVYKRRRGVFQGSPLLATFCDLVYSELANKLYISTNDSQEAILLRLADDFLFLSTRKRDCKKMFELATSALALNYGAYINHEKCSFLESMHENKFDFVGLEIDLKTLTVRKGRLSAYKLPSKAQRSFERVLSYLEWNYGVRLGSHLLDLNYSTQNAILDNIRDVLEPTFESLRKYLPSDINETPEEFSKLANFCLAIFLNLMRRIESINGKDLCISNLPELYSEVMSVKLLKQLPQISKIISFFESFSTK